jgi:hypothetical protein
MKNTNTRQAKIEQQQQKIASLTLYKTQQYTPFWSEARSGYVGIIQTGPILQNSKEHHWDNCDNNQDRTSLTNTCGSNKGRLLERSLHTKT